jgi:hypothetical protein
MALVEGSLSLSKYYNNSPFLGFAWQFVANVEFGRGKLPRAIGLFAAILRRGRHIVVWHGTAQNRRTRLQDRR